MCGIVPPLQGYWDLCDAPRAALVPRLPWAEESRTFGAKTARRAPLLRSHVLTCQSQGGAALALGYLLWPLWGFRKG